MNDIDKMPSKCRDCAYWELASYPWCCGDCVDKMNPKNSEYIKRGDAKRALSALPADLDAETVQRCIEAINNPKAADVEPKRRWIPVTKRLPKTNEKVLVYVFDPDFCGPYIEFGHWLNWLKRWGEFDDEVGDFGDYTIIAWMSLPELPKEEE